MRKGLSIIAVWLLLATAFAGCLQTAEERAKERAREEIESQIDYYNSTRVIISHTGNGFYVEAKIREDVYMPSEKPTPSVYSAFLNENGRLDMFRSFCNNGSGQFVSKGRPGCLYLDGKTASFDSYELKGNRISFSSSDNANRISYDFFNYGVKITIQTNHQNAEWDVGINNEKTTDVTRIYCTDNKTRWVKIGEEAPYNNITLRAGAPNADKPILPIFAMPQKTLNYVYRYVDFSFENPSYEDMADISVKNNITVWGINRDGYFHSCLVPEKETIIMIKVRHPIISTEHYKVHTGSEHVYNLIVPSWYEPNKKWPLIIDLHGFGGDHIAYMNRQDDWTFSMQASTTMLLDAIKIMPMCHDGETADANKDMWYNKTAEKYIFELVDIIKIRYNIDEDRIMVMGDSMGGHGTLSLVAHYPDMFSAFCSIFPPVDLETLYYCAIPTKILPSFDAAGTMEKAFGGPAYEVPWVYRMFSGLYVCENFLNLPILFGQGATELMIRPLHCDRLASRLDELGYKYVYINDILTGHDDASYFEILDRAMDHLVAAPPRNPSPNRVVYKTNDPYYGKAYWIRINNLEKEHEFAVVDAKKNMERNGFDIKISNVGGFIIDCRLMGLDFDRKMFLSINADCKANVTLEGKWTEQIVVHCPKCGNIRYDLNGDMLSFIVEEGYHEIEID